MNGNEQNGKRTENMKKTMEGKKRKQRRGKENTGLFSTTTIP